MVFVFFILFIVLLRIAELIYSKSNERLLLKNNAIEYGKAHYPYMIALHTSFLVSLIVEFILTPNKMFHPVLLIIYALLIAIKIWVLQTLGKYWNTKIYRIPNTNLVNKGPYKYIKHPNYLIVIAEIIIIPLAFDLYITAVVFTLLNLLMLYVRIKEEDKALSTATY